MNVRDLRNDETAVTPVVGIILMISITVLLAATVGAYVMGLEDEGIQQTAPTVAIEFDYGSADAAGESDVLKIIHDTGGKLDEDQTYLDVKDAGCDGGPDPDGQYRASDSPFGQVQPISAGMSLTLDGSVCSSGELDLDRATVKVVWRAQDGTASNTVATWHGPDASY